MTMTVGRRGLVALQSILTAQERMWQTKWSQSISVIDTSNNNVTETISLDQEYPDQVAFNPSRNKGLCDKLGKQRVGYRHSLKDSDSHHRCWPNLVEGWM